MAEINPWTGDIIVFKEVHAGAFIRPHVRKILEQAKFYFKDGVSYIESKTFLTSTFTISGSEQVMDFITESLDELSRILNKD
jgi:hypothetical protein